MDKNALSRYLTAVTMQVEKLAPFRINYIASVTGAKSYLEIGVRDGATFFNISLEDKVGVDPAFLFEPQAHTCDGVSFCPLTSDEFFFLLTAGGGKKSVISNNNCPLPQTFDIIFMMDCIRLNNPSVTSRTVCLMRMTKRYG